MHAVYSRAEEVCIYWGEFVEQSFNGSEVKNPYHPSREDSEHRREIGVDVFSRDQNLCTAQEIDKAARLSTKSLEELEVSRRGLEVMRKGSFVESVALVKSRGESLLSLLPFSSRRGKRPLRAPQEEEEAARQSAELKRRRLTGYISDSRNESPIEFIKALEESLLGGLASVASSPQSWWRRLWTVQELMLAKLPVVYFGPRVVLWTMLVRTWTQLELAKNELAHGTITEQMCLRNMRMDITHLNLLRDQPIRNLHVLLLATTDKGFTEPRDRIFALLGALPQQAISPDYSLDMRITHTSVAMHCIATQCTYDILFSQWKRGYRLICEANSLRSCVPNLDLGLGTMGQDWQTPCLTRPEQGRWESARVGTVPHLFSNDYYVPQRNRSMLVLNGKEISMVAIENTAMRSRIAFNGDYVTTVSKLYRLGEHDLDWMLGDLSRSPSQYSAESLCKGNRHWNLSTPNPREQTAYDIYTLLLESCSIHLEGYAGRSVDLMFETQRPQGLPFPTALGDRGVIHGPEECIELLAIAGECLRRPRNQRFTGPLASRRRDCTTSIDDYVPGHSVDRVLHTSLSAVLEQKTWSGSFFITSDGHLGIGPESTQPGDQIVVLDGARSPFVLRALKDSSDYALLGDSFVLGLMHGEVREMDARGEMESRTFVIQ
jgi:hypothetical protein